MEKEIEKILQSVLWRRSIPSSIAEEPALLKEMEDQKVLSLLGSRMAAFPLSGQGKQYCQKKVMLHYAFAQRMLYEQDLLVKLFEKSGIPMAILKGSAAAMYYPEPSYRSYGDVDFIVLEGDFDRAYRLMLSNGYELKCDEDHVEYHYTLGKNGIMFEIHRFPAGLPDDEKGLCCMKQIRSDLLRTEKVTMEGYWIPVLPAVSNGMVLLLHVRKHIEGGLGLRQIIDWMMFADRNLANDSWEREYRRLFDKAGLSVLAETLTRMCQLHLGLRKDITWCQGAEEELCEELWRYVMEKGNFGRKEGSEAKGKNFFSRGYSVSGVLKHLQDSGKKNWKLLKKYPFLEPLAWCYQAGVWAGYLLKRKNVIGSLRKDHAQGSRRARMLKRLK